MAPRERHNSDPRQTLVRSAANDILAGVFDGVNQLSPPSASAGGGAGDGESKESAEMKSKMKQQLEQLDSQTKASGGSQPKEASVSELQESVDSYLRSRGELSDTESVTDPLEFTCNTPDGKSMRARVARTARVAELKTAVQTETGVPATSLLLGALPLTDDNRPVYQLWARERLGRRVGQCSSLQMAPRCRSG